MTSSVPPSVFFDHSRLTLSVYRFEARLDVWAFKGYEHLSRLFTHTDTLLGHDASFSLRAAPQKTAFLAPSPEKIKPLRTLVASHQGEKPYG